mmetsp:Transcript_114320/g.210128  ORF Transcript_114320/g.210128 Transcript_114320/m.210128 type:complete len:403 (+) Transcript_114320:124-1332(+)
MAEVASSSGGVAPILLERTVSKHTLDKAVLEYLAACNVDKDLITQLRSELVEESAAAGPAGTTKPPDCRLTKVFQYAQDGSMEVAVSRLIGATDRFEVCQWSTLRELKELIESRLQIPVSEQQILRCGRQLKADSECLAAARVTFSNAKLELLRVEQPEAKDEDLQVFLTKADGIPAGSIVSIRAGNVRRQAPMTFDQPFRFPMKKDAANPFKINIFSQFGKARLVLRNAEDTYLAHIESEDGRRVATLEFEAKDSSERERQARKRAGGKDATPEENATAAKARKSVLVSRYLELHGLVEYMQNLIQSVMHEQPADPYQYMIRQLQTACIKRNEAAAASSAASAGRELPDSAAAEVGNASSPPSAGREPLEGSPVDASEVEAASPEQLLNVEEPAKPPAEGA